MRFKLLLLGFILILISSLVSATDYTVAVSQTSHPSDSSVGYAGGSQLSQESQRFNVSEDMCTDLVSVYFGDKFNTPPIIFFTIETDDGTGKPSGIVIESDANMSVDANGVPANAWYNLSYAAEWCLTADTPYILTSRVYTGVGGDNLIRWKLDTADPYSGGTRISWFDTGPWTIQASDDLAFIIYAIIPTIAPLITNLILISAEGNTNNTFDSTPTINITLNNDGIGCISNQSDGNYTDCKGRGGQCIAGEVDTKGICTLPSNQSLTVLDVPQTLYFWANSSTGINHNVFNNSIDVTLLISSFVSRVSSCYTNDSLGGCFAINWTIPYNQINWSDNITIHSGNYSWNFTELNITSIDVWMFNLTNNGTTNLSVNIKLSNINPSIWQLFYNNTNITSTSFINILNLSKNTTQFINFSLNLYNISETYVNWTLNRTNANWTFNYTIEIL